MGPLDISRNQAAAGTHFPAGNIVVVHVVVLWCALIDCHLVLNWVFFSGILHTAKHLPIPPPLVLFTFPSAAAAASASLCLLPCSHLMLNFLLLCLPFPFFGQSQFCAQVRGTCKFCCAVRGKCRCWQGRGKQTDRVLRTTEKSK